MKRQNCGTKGKTSGQKAKHWNSGTEDNIEDYLQTLPAPHTHPPAACTHTSKRHIALSHRKIWAISPLLPLCFPAWTVDSFILTALLLAGQQTRASSRRLPVGLQLHPFPSTPTGSPSATTQAFQHGESPGCDTHPGQLRLQSGWVDRIGWDGMGWMERQVDGWMDGWMDG